MMEPEEFNGELTELKAENASRDMRMNRIKLARTPGGLQQVFPDMFPDEGPYQEAMVANMVDVAAKDTAEVLAPPPTLSCVAAGNATDRARAFADKRTKINYGYFDASELSVGLFGMADQYVTYSYAIGIVKPDFDRKLPIIKFIDPLGCYSVYDQWNRTIRLYQTMSMTVRQASIAFPVLAAKLEREHRGVMGRLEITRVFTEDGEYLITPTFPEVILHSAPNPIGECVAHSFKRPGLDPNDTIGSYDDVLAVQVAKARFALLSLEAATKSVQAPLALPNDVQEINIGPDATLRSATPDKIRRVDLNIPQVAFVQQSVLDQEIRNGARYPETRTGNSDASIITGRGVQALGAGFDSQIKAAQTVIAHGIGVLFAKAMKMDEAIWPNDEKTIRGNRNGTPYELKYTPAKDIKGDYTINVQYGLMAGLQANQALVFGLQARGDKLISRSFLRTQLPISFDPSEEEAKVDVEDLRDALKEAFTATAQAIPALAQQGQAPTGVLTQMAAVIKARQKGIPIEDAIEDAFEPPEAETGGPDSETDDMAEMAAPPGAGGMPPGVPPEMAGGGGGAQQGMRPDMMQMIASLGAGGRPGLGASVIRRQAV
jgi:hypothetical protein